MRYLMGLCAAAKGRNHAKYIVSYCKNDIFSYQFMAKDANLTKLFAPELPFGFCSPQKF